LIYKNNLDNSIKIQPIQFSFILNNNKETKLLKFSPIKLDLISLLNINIEVEKFNVISLNPLDQKKKFFNLIDNLINRTVPNLLHPTVSNLLQMSNKFSFSDSHNKVHTKNSYIKEFVKVVC